MNPEKRILLLRSNNNHYDAILTPNTHTKRLHRKSPSNGTQLSLPFISDQISRKFKQVISKTGLNIRLIEKPGINLKQFLTRSALEKPCCKRKNCHAAKEVGKTSCLSIGAIYELKCKECNETYIGESGRPLHSRTDEHDRAIRLGHRDRSAMASHWITQHPTRIGAPGSHFSIKIICLERSTIKRKIKEALCIKKEKPNINTIQGPWCDQYFLD